MKVLGVVGSPRKAGNTDILVDEVLRGARDAGPEVRLPLAILLDFTCFCMESSISPLILGHVI